MALMAFAGALTTGNVMAATIHVPLDEPTIQSAINSAVSGTTILVAPGTYTERLDFLGKSIALVGEGGPLVTTLDAEFLGRAIKLETGEGPGTLIEGFTITRGFASFGAGISIRSTSPTIRNNIFRQNAQGGGGMGAAISCSSGSPIIEGNEFTLNSCDSQLTSGVISLVNNSSPQIHDNILHDNPCQGITVSVPIEAAPVIFNNTSIRNRSGIRISNQVPTWNHIYRNNLIAENNIGLELYFSSFALVAIWSNNLLYANTIQYSGTPSFTGTNSNLEGDPRFSDSANGDFSLRVRSIAIDAGTSQGLTVPAGDLGGSPRVIDGNDDGDPIIDIGALEAPVSDIIFFDEFEDWQSLIRPN